MFQKINKLIRVFQIFILIMILGLTYLSESSVGFARHVIYRKMEYDGLLGNLRDSWFVILIVAIFTLFLCIKKKSDKKLFFDKSLAILLSIATILTLYEFIFSEYNSYLYILLGLSVLALFQYFVLIFSPKIE